MSLLNILNYPNPYLRKRAEPISTIDTFITKLASDMLETMYHYSGIGLAATQVGVNVRLIVLDLNQENNEPMILINPEIIWHSKEIIKSQEGCLSISGIYEYINRYSNIRCVATDINSKMINLDASNLLSICLQHEIDHLNGIVFIDYLSNLKKDAIERKMKKINKNL